MTKKIRILTKSISISMQIPGKHHTPSAVGAAVEYRRRKIIIPSYLRDDRVDCSLVPSHHDQLNLESILENFEKEECKKI